MLSLSFVHSLRCALMTLARGIRSELDPPSMEDDNDEGWFLDLCGSTMMKMECQVLDLFTSNKGGGRIF